MLHHLKTFLRDTPVERRLVRLTVALLLFDLLLIALNIVWRAMAIADLWPPRPDLLQIGNDYGLPEVANFAKYLLVAGLLATIPARRVWVPLVLVFVALFLDDAFRLHETAGAWIGRSYLHAFGPGKPAAALGQLVYALGFGVFAYGAAVLTLFRAEGPAQSAAWVFLGLLLLLGVFGVAIDFLNSILLDGLGLPLLGAAGSLVENGGEMVILSLAVYAAGLARQVSGVAR